MRSPRHDPLPKVDLPKSEAGERTIALGPKLAEELWQHRRRTAFSGDEERVFCHPTKGSPLDHKHYARTLRAAMAKAGGTRAPPPKRRSGRFHRRTCRRSLAGL